MSSRLPHTLDVNKMGMHNIQLVDPNDAGNTGPISRKREFKVVPPNPNLPLLQGWSQHCTKHRLIKPDHAVELWDQARWDADDERFLRRLPRCTAPEDVDDIMPQKWKPHRSDVDSDPRLERVTKLCTTIVNRVVDWTSGKPEWAPKSVADWNKCQALQRRIQDMLEFLESALGEAVGIAALKDPQFVRRCWRAMSEEDHSSFEDSIEQSAAYFYQQHQQQQPNSTQHLLHPHNGSENHEGGMMMMTMTEDFVVNENDDGQNDYERENYFHQQHQRHPPTQRRNGGVPADISSAASSRANSPNRRYQPRTGRG